MVWFQCEDCGENLKKPKLSNHFRICSAYKLSCIDCGEIFDKQSVQAHTQCITEAEKYGPKGQVKVANGTPAKPNKEKSKPDVDINVGLSERAPWFCGLCNTNATSQQTLLLHADGKKHRAKARAYAANKQAKPSEETTPANEDSTEKCTDDKQENDPLNGALGHDNSSADNGNVTTKKRKFDESKQDDSAKKAKCEAGKEGSKRIKIKWKKLIKSALLSSPDEALKMKKLEKLVLKSLSESGIKVDHMDFKSELEKRVHSICKFTFDGKYVRLVAKKNSTVFATPSAGKI